MQLYALHHLWDKTNSEDSIKRLFIVPSEKDVLDFTMKWDILNLGTKQCLEKALIQ